MSPIVGLGISLLTLLYFTAGGFVGEWMRLCFQGRRGELFENIWLLSFAVALNVAAIGCLVLLRRRAKREPGLQMIERPWEVLVRGFPLTNRVAFLLFTSAYAIGLFVALLFA